MKKNSVEIALNGTEAELSDLFSFSSMLIDTKLTSLGEFIGHFFNQTLQRDGFTGAWAMCFKEKNSETYVLKMTSIHHDLSLFEHLVPAFLEAGKVGLQIYNENLNAIKEEEKKTNETMQFLLPWGLSMASARSLQLLHFPPLETFVYLDYLFSPTNRRCEDLLEYNKANKHNFPFMESIVDLVPIAAPGGDSKGIAEFNEKFIPYVKAMISARLEAHWNKNIPIVAYGGPVMDWLQKAFPQEVKKALQPLDLLELPLSPNHPNNPVLCANHPSKYLYYTDKNDPKTKREIMFQDLVAAGWQNSMATDPSQNPHKLLEECKRQWHNNEKLDAIIHQEDEAFSFMA
jgi:hypothetical protein